jgi:hypothetical protein
VFARQQYGKIAPHKLFWPAFWAYLEDGIVEPIDLETIRQTAGRIVARQRPANPGDWRPVSDKQIIDVLKALSSRQPDKAQPVYITGGKLRSLDDKGSLIAEQHNAARPYLWPVAHNVRPAAQSLGVKSCQDCHSADAPFFFGEVAIDSPIGYQLDSPLVFKKQPGKTMIEFQDINVRYAKLFAFTFVFRPWLKVIGLASSGLLAAVLLLYALKALACVTRVFVGKRLEDSDLQ